MNKVLYKCELSLELSSGRNLNLTDLKSSIRSALYRGLDRQDTAFSFSPSQIVIVKNEITKEEKNLFSHEEVQEFYDNLPDKDKINVLQRALSEMQAYNGRTETSCIFMALGYEYDHDKKGYVKCTT